VQQRSAAEKCALLVGLLLLAAGVVGFFYNGTFTSNEAVHDDMLGTFAVNGWSNTLYVLIGIWGLAAAGSWEGARAFGYGAGLLLTAMGAWGFILGKDQSILSIIPVNGANSAVWLALGVIAVLCAVLTSPEPDPTTVAVQS
jgi:Domain of unknown function (DUF4383)